MVSWPQTMSFDIEIPLLEESVWGCFCHLYSSVCQYAVQWPSMTAMMKRGGGNLGCYTHILTCTCAHTGTGAVVDLWGRRVCGLKDNMEAIEINAFASSVLLGQTLILRNKPCWAFRVNSHSCLLNGTLIADSFRLQTRKPRTSPWSLLPHKNRLICTHQFRLKCSSE